MALDTYHCPICSEPYTLNRSDSNICEGAFSESEYYTIDCPVCNRENMMVKLEEYKEPTYKEGEHPYDYYNK